MHVLDNGGKVLVDFHSTHLPLFTYKRYVGVGHLPKKDPESCIAWLYGKMLVTLLVERLYREADFFPLGISNMRFHLIAILIFPEMVSGVLGEN